jgi:signal peptidase I
MFPFTPSHVRQGRQFIKDARKLVDYKRDIVSPETLAEVQGEISRLELEVKGGNREAIGQQMQRLDTVCGKLTTNQADAGWRENVEVFLVAIVIALAVRTYFLQPFTIPTGSMQPTLNGIIAQPVAEMPNPVSAALQKVLSFRTYFQAIADEDDRIVMVEEVKRFRFFTYSLLRTEKGHIHYVKCPAKPLTDGFDLYPGRVVKKGEPIVQGFVDTGDHVFVDKFTYNFIRPKHDEVFVFSTKGIHRLTPEGRPSQYYIKRLVGLPGDTMRVDPPRLFINDEVAPYSGMQKVMSGTENAPPGGYRGYGNGDPRWGGVHLVRPVDSYQVPEKHYWAMGDNSYNSFDSRGWGAVPQQNIAGRALFVYYPFRSHFGRIR